MNALIAMAAALPTIFGLQIGAPVTLPECVHSLMPGGRYAPDRYPIYQIRLCQELRDVSTNPSNSSTIAFPVDQMPSILAAPQLTVKVIDDKLEAISATTRSFWSADAIIGQLVEKFGPPTRRTEVAVPVRLRSIPGTQLLWIGEGYRIEYHTIGASLDHGWLHIETDKARALADKDQREIDKKRTPL